MGSNQVLEALPNCYRQQDEQQEIVDALTSKIAELYALWDGYLDTYERDRLDPATCFESWLDTLAEWAGWGDYWDSSWSVAIKRKLIKNSDYIWANRGNREILPYLFGVFGLNARLEPDTGWMLGVATLPVSLGGDPFSYVIRLPTSYAVGTPEYTLVNRLVKNFLPCWISLQYKFV
ncbi:MAG: hypothetical protein KME30_32080 [Iphinoe sp. HA4291-MV1]|jgi:phage tail-like protein|nr:hypothetical protein [Iphinoe sp. HA4291-MV1]